MTVFAMSALLMYHFYHEEDYGRFTQGRPKWFILDLTVYLLKLKLNH